VRVVEKALNERWIELDAKVKEIFKYAKNHNDAVFSACDPVGCYSLLFTEKRRAWPVIGWKNIQPNNSIRIFCSWKQFSNRVWSSLA
jgi:hypothetical protein